jgi:predicted transcriptional regulator
MARKQTPTLTEAELRIMKVVWQSGEASVNDVLTALPDESKLAYNTVLTTMRILERKGYLKHAKQGRAYLYKPLVNRAGARSKAVQHMIHSFFDNSPEALMVSIMEDEKITAEELQRLRDMIGEKG